MPDFFELGDPEPGRGGVRRDRAGNALLLPKGVSHPDHRAPFTSASSLADCITDDYYIRKWEKRYLAKGMSISPDLCGLGATEFYTTGFSKGDSKENAASGRRLDDIAQRALDRVGIHERADYGTAVHSFTEPVNTGTVPERMKSDVDSFWACVRDSGIKILDTETFTANDTVMSAGTFDHFAWVPGVGYCITDKKTGSMRAHEFGIQLAVYAYGDLYDPVTDARDTFENRFGVPVNREVGIVFAIKNGVTKLKTVNLVVGWRAARCAAWVRDYHERKDIMADYRKPELNG